MASDDHLEGDRSSHNVASRSDADDEPLSNPRPEDSMGSGRHRNGGLAGRDDANRSVRHDSGKVERGLHQASRINRCDTRADDGNEIVAKNVERTSQCVCLGSDQAERPVTTSNCFRSELTN